MGRLCKLAIASATFELGGKPSGSKKVQRALDQVDLVPCRLSSLTYHPMSTVALTKKQQKAQAFRSKQKAKKSGRALPEDVPESDIPDEDIGEDGGVIAEASSSKKRKRGDAEAGDGEGKEGKPEDLTGGAKGKAKSIGKGKGKWEEDGEEDGKATKKSKKEIKQRFILFIGGSEIF